MCEEARDLKDVIYKSIFPAIVKTLIRQGKLDADKLQDEEYFELILDQLEQLTIMKLQNFHSLSDWIANS
jgi:hypothetical protein